MKFRIRQDQRGTLYEIPILIALLLVVGAVFAGNLEKLGFTKALIKTGIVLGCIVGPFVILFLVFWAVRTITERLGHKPPQDPK
jgi:hypothetical protein